MNYSQTKGSSSPMQNLINLTQKIDDQWLNRESFSILNSSEYGQLIELFPALRRIFEEGAQKEPQEFGRTLSHIFRSVAIYNQLENATFQYPQLDQEKLHQVYKLFTDMRQERRYLLPLILWLHDIGKTEDRENHTQASFDLVEKYGILNPFGLSVEEDILIKKVIQHHLVIGTLYTGEGSFFIFQSLLQDRQMQELIHSSDGGKYWTDFSTIFTIIDLCGYPYNKLTNAHIDGYFHLIGTIGKIFLDQNKRTESIKEEIREVSREMIDWRLGCFLRMFMFLHRTKDHTFENYLKALLKGTSIFMNKGIDLEGWQVFKETYLSRFPRIQFKYGLAFLCRLGLNNLDQWLNPSVPEQTNPQLIRFMVSLDERIGKDEERFSLGQDGLWEVAFQNYPKWGEDNRLLEEVLVMPGVMEKFIASGEPRVRTESHINTLNLDFKPLLSKI